MYEHVVVLFLVILHPNSGVKGLDFGVFSCLGLEAFLVEII
jgi:hypothetical protein